MEDLLPVSKDEPKLRTSTPPQLDSQNVSTRSDPALHCLAVANARDLRAVEHHSVGDRPVTPQHMTPDDAKSCGHRRTLPSPQRPGKSAPLRHRQPLPRTPIVVVGRSTPTYAP